MEATDTLEEAAVEEDMAEVVEEGVTSTVTQAVEEEDMEVVVDMAAAVLEETECLTSEPVFKSKAGVS